MTQEHWAALLGAADTKKDDKGWHNTPEGRLLTLYTASNGVGLTVGRVEAAKLDGELLYARTVKGETYVLALADIFTGSVDAPATTSRKAGFV